MWYVLFVVMCVFLTIDIVFVYSWIECFGIILAPVMGNLKASEFEL